eukprot:GCRY01001545.1.p1 GENE.GCRY01001545.1~~GCRY01001545.1.p1  ORF type:complete len:278 (+),score=41.41 GCRY01001545.1:229-1062(+)
MSFHSSLPAFSTVIGWIYFSCWSISFFPQAILNYRRKKVTGLCFDFVTLNLLGFGCYGLYCYLLYFDHRVIVDYKKEHDTNETSVRINDLAFVSLAFCMTLLTLYQLFIYERDEQTFARWALALIAGSLLFAIVVAVTWAFDGLSSSLFFIDTLAGIKLLITGVKYIPQVVLNYQRKCTVGWSIMNIILDFSGGFFSLLQSYLDATYHNDWTIVYGNPAKLGLSLLSISFDIVFLVQHYVLYTMRDETVGLIQATVVEPCASSSSPSSPSETSPLLA